MRRRTVSIFVSLTAMVVLVVLGSGVAFASDSDAARFEAEGMSENSSKISVVDDNGTRALRFVNTGASASKSVGFSANARMAQIRVRGVDSSSTAPTLPSVRVTVDGTQVLSQQVSGSYSTLAAPIDVGGGSHTVSVNMTNQTLGDSIFVDWLAFTYPQAPPPPPPDADGDGVEDGLDNCPNTANADQADADGDGVGDACEGVDNPNLYNVKSYGAAGDGTTDDSAAFKSAVQAASQNGGGNVYVPAPGTYRIADVRLLSNVTVQIEAGAVIQKAPSTGWNDIFHLAGPNDTTFGTNQHIEGVNGNFVLDMSNSPSTGTNGIFIRNVKNFSVKHMDCIQNNSNQLMLSPTSRAPCLMFRGTPAGPVNGVYNHPNGGELVDLHSYNSPFGFGLTQVTTGENLTFRNISSDGGVALRVETDGNNRYTVDNLVADGVTCTNGHAPVHLVPWGQNNGKLTITNVRSNGCEEGLSVLGTTGGFSSASTISGVDVVAGPNAQLRTPDTGDDPGLWYIGPSRWCQLWSLGISYSVGVSNISCGGLPDRFNY